MKIPAKIHVDPLLIGTTQRKARFQQMQEKVQQQQKRVQNLTGAKNGAEEKANAKGTVGILKLKWKQMDSKI